MLETSGLTSRDVGRSIGDGLELITVVRSQNTLGMETTTISDGKIPMMI